MNTDKKDKGKTGILSAPKILIVEDEAIVAKDIETCLSSFGYLICGIVSSGEEALVMAGHVRPNLILLDMMLKGKIDGIETAHRIKAQFSIPVIFLTAYSDENTISRARETNAFGYLLKPFEERELRSTIEMALYKHETERKLTQNKQWLETILCCIADAVITTDLEGVIEFANPVAERLTGFSAREMLARRLTEMVRLKNSKSLMDVEINPKSVHENGGYVSSETDIVLIAKDGSKTAVEYSVAPLKYSDDTTVGLVLVLRDIAVKQEAMAREQALQSRLFRAQRMESLGMLANGVARQLHRIVGPIIDYPDAILTKIPPELEIKQDLAMIQNSARKAIDILNDLITLGQMRDYSAEPLPINALVEDFINSPQFQTQKQKAPLIEFHMDPAGQSLSIIGCKQYLLVLLNSLVSHAYSVIPKAGIVKVSAELVKITEPVSGFEIIEEGDYAVLKVSDTGPGMDEKEINRFFEPFVDKANTTERQQEKGLRTAIAYAIIKGHKGMIDIKSSPGKGTEIIIYFPIYFGPVATTKLSEDRAARDYSGRGSRTVQAGIDVEGMESLLLVDDDNELRKTTAAYLRSVGYKVIGAKNGNEAIELFKKTCQNKEQAFDLVVLDMIMADTLDGLDIYKTMLQYNPRQKAIIVSGFTITERIKTAMQLGVGQHLLKPYDHEELGRAVRKELDKPIQETASQNNTEF